MTDATGAAELRPLQVEMNGINVISESERKGHPRHLFWPWFAANISVLGLSYGAFVLYFGISFAQALVVGVVGIVLSFLACGFIAVAGNGRLAVLLPGMCRLLWLYRDAGDRPSRLGPRRSPELAEPVGG
jgi:cytosine/uracil/thiamine/allantoin permease